MFESAKNAHDLFKSARGLIKEAQAGGSSGTFVKFKVNDAPSPENGPPTFLGAAGKLIDIKALNNTTSGLKTVVKIASAGGPKLTNLINEGGRGVLKVLMGGQDPDSVLGAISKINPNQVNIGIAQGDKIIDQIKEGKFKEENIPAFTRDLVGIVKTGLRIAGVYGKNKDQRQEVTSAQNYAKQVLDVYGGVKLPFRYVVKFNYLPEYTFLESITPDLFVKTFDRPQIDFESEDINVYNYRTKVIKKTNFNPVNITFYDDQLSHVLSFVNSYLNLMSPITNTTLGAQIKDQTSGMYGSDDDELMSIPNDRFLGYAGKAGTVKMDTYDNVNAYSASLGALSDATKLQQILENIIVFHIYQGGGICDVYELYRPKILQIQMDQLNSTASSESNNITMQVAYDSVHIQTYMQTAGFKDLFTYTTLGDNQLKDDLEPNKENTVLDYNTQDPTPPRPPGTTA